MIETIKLENGVSIVLENMENVRSIAFGIFVKNGSINENEKTNGISHFIEHMFFKGTKTKSAKNIAEDMDNIGGQLNAFTSKEYTCYYSKVLDTHIDKAIDTVTDMFFNSNFDENEIKKECKVILEEISMYEDSPEDVVFSKLQKNIWKNSSLGQAILGVPNTVKSFTRDDFMKYLDEKYVGENTIVVLVGNFDKEKMKNTLSEKFCKMKKGSPSVCADKKVSYFKSTVKTFKDIEQIHLCLAFEGISLKSKYNYSISLLNTVFGGGISSILFQKVREEHGSAYSIYSYNSNYIANGLFSIYAGLNKAKLNDTISIIKEEIQNLQKNKISIKQINKTKEQLKSNYIMGMESSFNKMSSIGRSKVLTGKIKTQDEIISSINNISKKDIDYLIENIFNLDKMSISIVGKTDDITI